MRLCSFRHKNAIHYGAEIQSGIVAVLGDGSLDDVIAAKTTDVHALQRAVSDANKMSTDDPEFRWLPPVIRPSKIIGVATNSRGLQEMAYRRLAAPAFFLKPSSCLAGHGDPIIVSEHFGVTHPEPELALIIGNGGKNIEAADALGHVFGYTIINDVTSAGLKEQDSIEIIAPQHIAEVMGRITWREMLVTEHERRFYYTYHTRSKGTDTFGPMGPVVVTAEEIADPNKLQIVGYWEDEAFCEDNTRNLTFSVQEIIAHASKYMTLVPGDVIHCGTSLKMIGGSRFPTLQSCNISKIGGSVAIEIEGIGRLSNPVVIEK